MATKRVCDRCGAKMDGGFDDATTINTVEIVYCKDCKYGSYDSKPDGAMVCLRTNDGFWRKETDFCSYGERREE